MAEDLLDRIARDVFSQPAEPEGDEIERAAPAALAAPPRSVFEEAYFNLMKGANTAEKNNATLSAVVGGETPEAAWKARQEAEEWDRQNPETAEYMKAEADYKREVGEDGSFADAMRFWFKHPSYAASTALRSAGSQWQTLPLSAGGAALGTMAAGPVGTAVGFAGGALAGSGFSAAADAFEEFAAKRGFDLKSEEQWRSLFGNPALMREARRYAATKGVAIGAVDAAAGFFGARGGGRMIVEAGDSVLRSLSKAGAVAGTRGRGKQALLETVANLGVDASAGVAGEAAADLLADGKVSIPDLVAEGLLGVALGGPMAALETALSPAEKPVSTGEGTAASRAAGRGLTRAPETEELPAVGREARPERQLSFEEAKAEGREWVGFISPAGATVYRDPAIAERQMGGVDPRTGRLVAAKADEVTMNPRTAVASAKAGIELSPMPKGWERHGSWMNFLKSPTEANYIEAVERGVRVPPGPKDPDAWLVEPTAVGVWGSERVPVGKEQVQAWKGAKIIESPNDVDMESLLSDPDATVYPSFHLMNRLLGSPRLEEVAGMIFEGPPPAGGWRPLLDRMYKSRTASLAAVRSGEVRMRPGFSHTLGKKPSIVVESNRPMMVTETEILERHRIRVARPKGITSIAPDFTLTLGAHKSPEEIPQKDIPVATYFAPDLPAETMLAVTAIGRMADKLRKTFRLKRRFIIAVGDGGWDPRLDEAHVVFRDVGGKVSGRYAPVGLDAHAMAIASNTSPFNIYMTFMHEFGHALSFERFSSASIGTQLRIFAAYRRWLASADISKDKHTQNMRRRRHGAAIVHGPLRTEFLIQDDPDYWHSFEEWFAEQVARWGATDARPLGDLSRFFRSLANEVKRMVRFVRNTILRETRIEESLRAEPEMETWLNAMYDGQVEAEWGQQQEAMLNEVSAMRNAQWGVEAPRQAEAEGTAAAISRFGGPALGPKRVGMLRAHIDDAVWRFKKHALGLQQITLLHQDIAELRTFSEIVARMDLDSKRIMARAEDMLKGMRTVHGQGRKVGGKTEMERFAGLIFDLVNTKYLSDEERAAGARRTPTEEELLRLQREHQLSPETMKVYRRLEAVFREVAMRQEEATLLAAARRIKNPGTLAKRVAQIKAQTQAILQSPFFPMMQFGRYGVVVRDANGEVEFFASRETVREQEALLREARRMYPQHPEPTQVTLPEEVQQWQGLLPWFLDEVALLPGMAEKYGGWINMLRVEVAPRPSFRKLAFERKGTRGFSENLERVFAAYMFRHARNYARVKHSHGMGQQIVALRERAALTPGRQNLLTNISHYMERTRESVLNPVKDWHGIRSAAAVWHLGFSAAAATQNLMQTPTITLPFLAGKFGDAKAIAALVRATKDQRTFYRRSNYENSDEMTIKMMDYLVKKGKITENLAAALASVSSGGRVFGGSKLREKWIHFTDKAMWMFSMMEQLNRRLVAMATLDLAQRNPGAKWLQTVQELHHLQYEDLKREGFSPSEARAMLAAETALDQTQYNASQWAQPRFVQGRKSALLMFFMYTQNTLFTLAANRDMWIRYALIMTVLAGPLGLVPDDIEDIVNWMGRKALGRDFNIERDTREFLVELLGDSEALGYKVQPDLLLHGISRYGFGIPALMDMIGVTWWPQMDRSKAITLNRIIPLAPTALLQPGVDYERAVSEATQQVSGAAFGVGFAVLKALMNNDLEWSDPKRWEGAMPRAMRGTVRAFRLATQGGERLRNYSEVIPYDVNDREHVGELIGIGLGYQPERQQNFWDRYRAKQEVNAYWDIERGLLLDDAYRQRYFYKDKKAFGEVLGRIRKFNKELPYKEKSITEKTLEQSAKARLRARQEVEKGGVPGVPPSIEREMNRLYPGEVVGRRKLPGQ